MTVRVNVELKSGDRRTFADQVISAAKPQMRRDANRVGERMVEEGTKQIRKDFITDRPPLRRRTPGAVRLENSLTYEIEEIDKGVIVRLTTKRGILSAKVAALNYGSRPHSITAVNSKWLRFPNTKGLSGRAKQVRNAYGKPQRMPRSVNHPGVRGRDFMGKARRNAVRALRR